ncbi:hypothetical protein DPMN_048388 [Dreissena polymorpha]|uniref:Uncharacterized protein n=1 Tax=Dreissena polymorpha TaxID=45954 RepID=A0A9D4DDC0_DREPO|nr:hypothetical protein DPMN_048388 [Dreissena polymorpha]
METPAANNSSMDRKGTSSVNRTFARYVCSRYVELNPYKDNTRDSIRPPNLYLYGWKTHNFRFADGIDLLERQ